MLIGFDLQNKLVDNVEIQVGFMRTKKNSLNNLLSKDSSSIKDK